MLLSEENYFNDFSAKLYSKKHHNWYISEEWHSGGNTIQRPWVFWLCIKKKICDKLIKSCKTETVKWASKNHFKTITKGRNNISQVYYNWSIVFMFL